MMKSSGLEIEYTLYLGDGRKAIHQTTISILLDV